jgi:predicted AlkP superfamily phosphohydrolase/phosphomutase
VLALGLSEASWTILRDPSYAAHLPNLTRLAAQGACGTTLAPQPLVSNAMWRAVANGEGSQPVWRVLEDAGIATGTFNLKITERPERVSGFMIARDPLPAFHEALVHPPWLYPRLKERFGAWPGVTLAHTREEWTSLVPREIETRADVLIDLLRTRPWQFVLAHLPEVSRAQHRFWSDGSDTLRTVYAAADRAIGRIVEAAGSETVVVIFSECGAGPIRHGVQLNAWLEREGFLRRHRAARTRIRAAAARLAMRTYFAVRRRSSRLGGWTEVHLASLKQRTRAEAAEGDVDFTRTQAYSPGASGKIVVTDPAAANELRTRLLALRDPEGRRVVEEILGDGELTIVWDDDAYMPAERHPERDRVFVDWDPESRGWTFTGSHRREGVLIVNGPGIERGELGQVPTTALAEMWMERVMRLRTEDLGLRT